MADESIGQKVRRLREKKGWSQGKLSAKMGLNNSSYVSKLESGGIEHPTFERLSSIAKALGVHDWELTGGAPPPGASDTQFVLALGDVPAEVDGAEVIAKFDALPPEYKAIWLASLDVLFAQHLQSKKLMRAAMQTQRRKSLEGQPQTSGVGQE